MSALHHQPRRSFFGPIPEKVLTHLQSSDLTPHSDTGEADFGDTLIPNLINRHAYSFFLHEGGNTEDWTEEEHQNITQRLIHRWKESEWGVIHDKCLRNPQNRYSTRWVGNSFEIGDLFGLDLLCPSPGGSVPASDKITSATSIQAQASQEPSSHPQSSNIEHAPFASSSAPAPDVRRPVVSSSSTNGLLRPGFLSKAVKLMPDVRVADSHGQESVSPATSVGGIDKAGTATNDHVSDTSSAVLLPSQVEPGNNVVLRDRMLVRVYSSKSDLLDQVFDESVHRTSQQLHYEAWAEYLVVLRNSRIELYDDYDFPGKERFVGHKHLAFVIPISVANTRLSLYSFVDLTFCLTCVPTSRSRNSLRSKLPFLSRGGSNIFIFKVKSRSRAYDWAWFLWRRLEGSVPSTLEIRVPRVDTTVTIDAPDTSNESVFDTFTRDNVKKLSMRILRSVPDWNSLIQQETHSGAKLELAWRSDTNLDWIWLDMDIHDKPRKWAMLCGIVSKQSSRPAILEIRLAEHYPTHVHLKNGQRVHEPPGVEGYLQKISPTSTMKRLMYLSTHDGYLFVLPSHHAYPPAPPWFVQPSEQLETSNGLPSQQAEVQRGALQIVHALGVCDLRNVVAIRRAFQMMPPQTHSEQEVNEGDTALNIWSQGDEVTEEDANDLGGEDGLSQVTNRSVLRMRRSFELLLRSGRVIRFEAYSCHLALDWIQRLRALIAYWKQRHRSDARQEMDLAVARRPRLTPLTRKCQEHAVTPEAPPDLSTFLPALVNTYHWCMIAGCRPIVRGGKLFMRKGLRGTYKLVQMFLVTNHLIQYLISPTSTLHPLVKKINLTDAYICSGYMAALVLPEDEFNPSRPAAPRRYQDGLETDDKEEDIIFMIRYYPPPKPIIGGLYTNNKADQVPSLSAKRKVVIFRTRSKLERDAWCWAINCEIEKSVRAKEDAIHESGTLIS
ncbi:hypothetical protein AMATHDRAFT_740 [Amanita thiersii Skay4041]|uniref:PH domain-containing protein n=1 Tax=Amanita thiersii Skay4041 TaxID=703135 RepID=A0A2A9NWW3_9AGAR|nr:hypothetical protein AMATHDRAFT_740 [Amanita thiersii Skay4041]